MGQPADDDWSDEDMDGADAAVRTVGDWLMAQGIVGWMIDAPEPGEPVEVQLHCENRAYEPRIRDHFGDTVIVTILPEDGPRFAPSTTLPPEHPETSPEA